MAIFQTMVKPKRATNAVVAITGQSLGHSDFLQRGSHENKKIVVVDREDFVQFSVKKDEQDINTTEKDIGATDSIIQQPKSRLAKICDEKNCFEPIIFSVSEESIQGEALENVFQDKYLEGRGTPRLFIIKVQSHKTGYAVFHVNENSSFQDTERICSSGETHCVRISLTFRCSISKE